MTRILGVLNYKGGAGKTTTVVNLAAGLALRGARVLCIDLDAQGSLATYLGVRSRLSLSQLLMGQASAADCAIKARPNLELIPSDSSLLQAEGYMWRMGNPQAARAVLSEAMNAVNSYDFIILDYSPSVSLLSENGLLYTQEIIVPVATSYLALVGARQVIETLKTIGRLPEHRARLAWIVPTFFYSHLRKDREVMETLQHYFAGKVADPIRTNVKLAEAPSHQMSIYEYAPQSTGAIDYARLVERVANYG